MMHQQNPAHWHITVVSAQNVADKGVEMQRTKVVERGFIFCAAGREEVR